MLPSLQKSFDRMEKSRLRILQLTSGLSEPQAHAKPGPVEWSVVQVLEHIVVIDLNVLRVVQKEIAKSGLRPAGLKAGFRLLMLKLALRYRKKIKAPAVLPEPAGDRSLEEWQREWEKSRQQWRQLLDNVPETLPGKELFKHPLAGYLTLGQTLDFITEHTNHHVPQVQRLKQNA